MLHAKCQDHRTSGSVEYFEGFFTMIYGCGGHLGHVTHQLSFPLPIEAPQKFGFDWQIGFGEDV